MSRLLELRRQQRSLARPPPPYSSNTGLTLASPAVPGSGATRAGGVTEGQDTVDAAGSFSDAGTADRVVIKLDDASTKLTESKYDDAVAKLVSYQTTLTELATAPKLKVDAATATTLTAQAQGVIDCILTLG